MQAISFALGKSREDPAPCQRGIHTSYCLCVFELLQDLGTIVSGCFLVLTGAVSYRQLMIMHPRSLLFRLDNIPPGSINTHMQISLCAGALCITFGCSGIHHATFCNFRTHRGCLAPSLKCLAPSLGEFLTESTLHSVSSARQSVGRSKYMQHMRVQTFMVLHASYSRIGQADGIPCRLKIPNPCC